VTTWTEKTPQPETWTADTHRSRTRVFDPAVFAPHPVFDAYGAGVWAEKTEQPETWTPR
jgi:hypothetical protein